MKLERGERERKRNQPALVAVVIDVINDGTNDGCDTGRRKRRAATAAAYLVEHSIGNLLRRLINHSAKEFLAEIN